MIKNINLIANSPSVITAAIIHLLNVPPIEEIDNEIRGYVKTYRNGLITEYDACLVIKHESKSYITNYIKFNIELNKYCDSSEKESIFTKIKNYFKKILDNSCAFVFNRL